MKNLFARVRRWIKGHKAAVTILAVVILFGIAAVIIVPRMFQSPGKEFPQRQQNTIRLSKMDLTSSVSATGTIESAEKKLVSAKVSGVEIKSVKVSEGDAVSKGQTLVTFDKTDLQDALSEAKENLSEVRTQSASEMASAKRRLSEAETTYQSEKSRLAKAVASAKKKYQSAKKEAGKAKTPAEKEKAETSLTQARSAYEQAVSEQKNTNKQNKSNIQSAKDSVTTAQNNQKKSVREAQKTVDEASDTLKECSVTAPMDGTVTAVGVEAGDSYNGGDMFEISNCTNLQVSTTVSEYDITKVKKGQRVVILTDATGETEIEGKITYVAVTAGSSSLSSSSNTGTASAGTAGGSAAMAGSSTTSSSGSDSGYTVRIKISKAEESLRIGMTAKCSIILKEADDVYAVPYDAVHTNESGEQVIYTIDSSGKKEVVVEKGMESDYYVEVSGDNLSEGMMVIVPTDDAETDESTEASGESSRSFSKNSSRDSSKGSGDSGFPNPGDMTRGGGHDGAPGGGMRPGM